MELVLLVNWLCIEAQSCKETGDISNIFSTIIGTVLGILIDAFISWLVYNRQEKTANKQEQVLEKIHEFEEKHDRILKNILKLDEKIDSLLENKSH